MSQEVSGEKGQQQEAENKIVKNFDSTMKKLVAIVGGKDNLTPTKRVKKDVLTTVVSDLLKEDKEEAEKAIKTELKELLSKHVLLVKELKKSKEDLQKLEENKMKEFTEAASKVFNKIDNLGQLESDYYTALSATNK